MALFIPYKRDSETQPKCKYITPEGGGAFGLEELQKYVGGYIQVIPCTDGKTVMVMDEEGKFKEEYPRQKENKSANNCVTLFEGDYICGDVIICSNEEVV
jgi:hypothetical protein